MEVGEVRGRDAVMQGRARHGENGVIFSKRRLVRSRENGAICFMDMELEVKRFVQGHTAHLDQCWG